jgi:hypothetical protein
MSSGVDKVPAGSAVRGSPRSGTSHTYRIVKLIVVFFRLYSVVLTEGSNLGDNVGENDMIIPTGRYATVRVFPAMHNSQIGLNSKNC